MSTLGSSVAPYLYRVVWLEKLSFTSAAREMHTSSVNPVNACKALKGVRSCVGFRMP